jgi:hypothetical protein
MDYEVLSPLAEVNVVPPRGLLPRVSDLNGKTVGLFAFWKWYTPAQMRVVGEVLKERLPNTKFSYFKQPGGQDTKIADKPYPAMNREILESKEYTEQLKEWLKTVDTVVTGHGD